MIYDVGGMDNPLIHDFRAGYEQGAYYGRPDIIVLAQMTGTTPSAFNGTPRGSRITQ